MSKYKGKDHLPSQKIQDRSESDFDILLHKINVDPDGLGTPSKFKFDRALIREKQRTQHAALREYMAVKPRSHLQQSSSLHPQPKETVAATASTHASSSSNPPPAPSKSTATPNNNHYPGKEQHTP